MRALPTQRAALLPPPNLGEFVMRHTQKSHHLQNLLLSFLCALEPRNALYCFFSAPQFPFYVGFVLGSPVAGCCCCHRPPAGRSFIRFAIRPDVLASRAPKCVYECARPAQPYISTRAECAALRLPCTQSTTTRNHATTRLRVGRRARRTRLRF